MELSPATIRNVMADLQDSGLLFSPHASAGRIPTEAGLRLFVDGLLEVGHLTEDERLTIEAQCAAEGRSVQQTLSEVTRVLSGLSNCAGLVVAPKSDSALRHIEFVSLAPGRALVVLVTEDGSVENRVVEVPNGMPASAMVEASNFLSARLVGKTIEEARGQIAAELELHRQDLDGLTQKLVEAGLATATGDGAAAKPFHSRQRPSKLCASPPSSLQSVVTDFPANCYLWHCGIQTSHACMRSWSCTRTSFV